MDFSLLYRVVWNPTEVFKLCRGKLRLEPYIFIGLLVILQSLKSYWGQFETMVSAPFALAMNLLMGFFLFLLFPAVDAVVVILTATIIRHEKPSFLSLLSASILCTLPNYIEAFMVLMLGYTPIGLGSLFPSIKNSYPFVFGMVGTVTPFFLWTIALWWIALKQLLSLHGWKIVMIVIFLVLVNMLLGGWLWHSATSLVPK